MRIYVDLFYNNIERFVANAFPVAKQLMAVDAWHELVRGFLRTHRATTPYFHEISQEFLEYVAARDDVLDAAPYLLELMHYEWVELALAVSPDEVPILGVDRNGNLLDGVPVLSPLVWPLVYRFPVHRIGPEYRPLTPPTEEVHLVVYRNRADDVSFMESNVVTSRLLSLLGERTGRDAIGIVAGELGREVDDLIEPGTRTLEVLRGCDIIAGVRLAP